MHGDMYSGKPQELKDQIGSESEVARFHALPLWVRMSEWVGRMIVLVIARLDK